MKDPKTQSPTVPFRESLVITDDQTWIWKLASSSLTRLNATHVRIPSSMPIGPNWKRFNKAPHFIVHWESVERKGGAIIEEILQMSPGRETLDRIIVLTMSPTHEDVVYLNELGVYRIVRLRPREKDLTLASTELERHLLNSQKSSPTEALWSQLQDALEALVKRLTPTALADVTALYSQLKPEKPTARSLDVEALLSSLSGDDARACELWISAIERNPHYYLAYHRLIDHHMRCQRLPKAYALLSKLQEYNKGNVSRLILMGELQKDMADLDKAEAHFHAALARDPGCSRALNGLAEVRFEQGRLEESRELLSRSHLAFRAAASLNRRGIELVRAKKYEDALEHYTKAQYVLPIQEKGPLLFFNIGLCYSRWGKPTMAREFLKIALIKDPTYDKARQLMQVMDVQVGQGSSTLTGT